MKIKDLAALITKFNPEAKVWVRKEDGVILETDNAEEQSDYNDGQEPDLYIRTIGEFE